VGADRSEVFVERVGDEVLEGAGPPVGDLVCDLLGWTLEAERGDLEEVGDFASALGVVADVPLRVGLGASDRVGRFSSSPAASGIALPRLLPICVLT
jgi:hypothetical protein